MAKFFKEAAECTSAFSAISLGIGVIGGFIGVAGLVLACIPTLPTIVLGTLLMAIAFLALAASFCLVFGFTALTCCLGTVAICQGENPNFVM